MYSQINHKMPRVQSGWEWLSRQWATYHPPGMSANFAVSFGIQNNGIAPKLSGRLAKKTGRTDCGV